MMTLFEDGLMHADGGDSMTRIIHQPSRTERDVGDGRDRKARAAPCGVRPRE
jgi:hypothetical protein